MFRSLASCIAEAQIFVFISNLLLSADHQRFNSVENEQHFENTMKRRLYRHEGCKLDVICLCKFWVNLQSKRQERQNCQT